MKAWLAMAPFWDPYCPPLGITSLQAYLKQRGHEVAICDYNTRPELWHAYLSYFAALQELLPACRAWNIKRLGPDYMSRHQMAWLSLREQPERYLEISRLILNIDGRQDVPANAVAALDQIFAGIYRRIDEITDEALAAHRPDLVGCTLLATTLPASLQILRRAKERDPGVRTVLGGPGPIMGAGADSPDTRRILERCPWVDNLVIGEGEVILDALLRGVLPRRTIVSLRDVAQLNPQDQIHRITRQGLIADIDTLPTPDYTGLAVNHYPKLSVGVSRGCAYQCSFCYETTYWKRYRKRPIESALRDLQALRERHDRTRFFLCDSLANFYADDLAQGLLRRSMDIRWDAYLRADKELIDPDYVSLLARGGMTRARLGLESADTDTLDRMNKQMTVEQMGVVLENLADAGIETTTLWIVGFPGEDERAFQNSLDFIREHREAIYSADPWQFIFHPTVGTEPVFGRLVAADSFESRYGMHRLYPEEYDDALLVQYYELDVVDIVPLKIDRVARMCAALQEAGIPNPYTIREWRAADRRWRDLQHRRADRHSAAAAH